MNSVHNQAITDPPATSKTPVETTPTSRFVDPSTVAASLWFTRLFAGAVIAHIAGNRPFGFDLRGIVTLALGVVAAAVIALPDRRPLRVAMNALVLATVWLEAPFIGNHWLVAGVISLIALIAETQGFWFIRFRPVAQGTTLIFYLFAAFAKLNAGFFDPSMSCGVFYANQSLSSWNLRLIPTGGNAALGIAVATTVIELAVPLLIIMKWTRPWGVMLAYLFHFIISFDLDQHFYDFTALLFALFSLFLADEVLMRLEGAARRYKLIVGTVAVSGVVLALAATYPLTELTYRIVQYGTFAIWLPIGAVLVFLVLRHAAGERGPLLVGRAGPVGILIMIAVLFNGLTPYLGIKTGTSFNMYANLVTTQGESNHYLVPQTLELVQIEYVEVIETDSPGLAYYVDSGYLVPERNLLDYLADHQDVSVIYVRGDETISGTGAELGRPLPLLVEKFGLFRSIDTERPPRCQDVWLAAY